MKPKSHIISHVVGVSWLEDGQIFIYWFVIHFAKCQELGVRAYKFLSNNLEKILFVKEVFAGISLK